MRTNRVLFTVLFALAVVSATALVGAAPIVAADPTGPPSASPGLPPFTDVPQYRMDPTRNFIQPGPLPAKAPAVAWTHDFDDALTMDPSLAAGSLIVGDHDGHLTSLDARTGRQRWQFTGSGIFSQAPSVANGIVLAADQIALHAIDLSTGTELWKRPLTSDTPRPTIAGGVVYVGTMDGAIKGFDLRTGADRWTWQGDPTIGARVNNVTDGLLVANLVDGELLAVNLADGSERWRFRGLSSHLGSLIAGDTVYAYNALAENETGDGQVAAIDIATGNVRWRFAPPTGAQAVAGVSADGILYVGTAGDGIYALADEGDHASILWHTTTGSVHVALSLIGDVLYTITDDGTQLALRRDDGSLVWQLGNGGSPTASPVVSGGMIFVADKEGGHTIRAYADHDLIVLAGLAPQPTPVASSVAVLPDPFEIMRATPASETGVTVNDRSDGPEGITMAVGPDGLLYVSDETDTITVIDPASGHPVRQFGGTGSAPGKFRLVKSMAFSPDGLLYAVDLDNKRVQVLDTSGNFVRMVGSFGTAEGQFVAPFMLTVDGDGSVYVLDTDSGTISKFDRDGAFAWRVGGPSGDSALRGSYDLIALADGSILVTIDLGKSAILLNPADGSVIGPWGDASIGGDDEPSLDRMGDVVLFQYVPTAMKLFSAAGQSLGARDYERPTADGYRFYPAPVFAPDGYGYSFDDTKGLLQIKVNAP